MGKVESQRSDGHGDYTDIVAINTEHHGIFVGHRLGVCVKIFVPATTENEWKGENKNPQSLIELPLMNK